MSFFMIQLIFAGLAVALIVVVGLVGRDLWRKRQVGATAAEPGLPWAVEVPEPVKPRSPILPKKAADPEPAAAPPVRRRQLASFVEAEQDAATEFAAQEPVEAPESVVEPEVIAEAIPEATPDEAPATPAMEIPAEAEMTDEPAAVDRPEMESPAEAELMEEPAAGGMPETEMPAEVETTDEPAFDTLVLARLESAFDTLQEGEITLDAYAEQVRGEEAAIEQRISALGDDGDPDAVEAALAARESVRWCLNWVEEQRVQD